jgi:hypothetical protein
MSETAPVGLGKAENKEVAGAPEQVGIIDATGRGMPEGMMPEGRQEGTPEGKESVVSDMRLVGRAKAVEARMAAERAKDFMLINEWNKFKDLFGNEWTV